MTPDVEKEHWRVTEEIGFVRILRTSLSYDDGPTCERGLSRLEQSLDRFATKALLIDSRQAKGTQDPDIERAIVQFSVRLSERFSRIATLVMTSVGVLQVQRLVRSRIVAKKVSTKVRVFNDEHAAIGYLTEGDAP